MPNNAEIIQIKSDTIQALEVENDTLRKTNSKLKSQNARLECEIYALKARLRMRSSN